MLLNDSLKSRVTRAPHSVTGQQKQKQRKNDQSNEKKKKKKEKEKKKKKKKRQDLRDMNGLLSLRLRARACCQRRAASRSK